MDNKQQLDEIYSDVQNNVSKLQQNLSHINIVSYLYKSQIENSRAINSACIQASVVRALFKSKYDVPHSAITFSIDTAQNVGNVVRVNYVNTPVPLYSNSAIYYSESSSIIAIEVMLHKYPQGIPYTNYWMQVARNNPSLLGLNDFEAFYLDDSDNNTNADPAEGLLESSIIFTPKAGHVGVAITNDAVTVMDSHVGDVVAIGAKDAVVEEVAPMPEASNKTKPVVDNAPKNNYVKASSDYGKPVFGLKTNLLYWAVAVPNIEFEFYLGKGVSLQLEGAYTWAGFVLPVDKSYYIWNAGAEVRFWLNNDAKFNGHFFGVHGGAGQYDMKFGQVGNQGDYYGAGITYGYMLPIKKRFHMEFSIGGGWANYSKLSYKYFNRANYEVSRENNLNYFGVTKAKIAVVWKF